MLYGCYNRNERFELQATLAFMIWLVDEFDRTIGDK